MDGSRRPSTAVFTRPFDLPGLGRSMPAGEYAVCYEARPSMPARPGGSVDAGYPGVLLIDLKSAGVRPADHDWFSVSLEALDTALFTDRLPASERAAAMLEKVLADAMVRLAVRRDPGLEARFRQLNARILGHIPFRASLRQEHGKRAGTHRSAKAGGISRRLRREQARPAA
ncbi:MAG: hypothetical protein AAF416_22355 [Pseudomonadota bacterium]